MWLATLVELEQNCISLFSVLTSCSSVFVEIFIGYSPHSSHLGPFSTLSAGAGAAAVATTCWLQYHKFYVECENSSLYLHDFLGPQISLSFIYSLLKCLLVFYVKFSIVICNEVLAICMSIQIWKVTVTCQKLHFSIWTQEMQSSSIHFGES